MERAGKDIFWKKEMWNGWRPAFPRREILEESNTCLQLMEVVAEVKTETKIYIFLHFIECVFFLSI